MPLAAIVSVLAAITVDSVAADTRGAVAFHYATPLTAAQLDWYSRFELLVTHDPLPRAQVDALRARGTKLALYEWSVAFYRTLATPWQRSLPQSALLNVRPLRGGAGSPSADAFYFDPASREHERDRAAAIAGRLRTIGYDGVFFDTTTAASVHPDARAEFERRHPGQSYDVAFARFLRALRRELRGGVIVTNQGFRAAEHVLPYVDIDVTESLITRPFGGKFVLRPWLDARDEWNSISFLMRNLIAPVQRAYPKVRFLHLNYLDADALEPAAIARVVAIARLYDAEAFVTAESLNASTREHSPAYFEDLGEARPRVESTAKKTAYRFFARGLVAVNFGREPLTIANASRIAYENVVTGERTSGRIVVPPGGYVMLRRR